jgi:hypothetical protein
MSSAPPNGASETARTCAHVVDVASTSVQDPATLARVRSDCDATLGQLEDRHHSLTSCMLATDTLAGIDACENPLPRYEPILRSLNPSYVDVCEHILKVMEQEMKNSEVAGTPGAEEIASFLARCAVEMEKEEQKIGPAEYRRQAACVMEARAMAEMQKCEPET